MVHHPQVGSQNDLNFRQFCNSTIERAKDYTKTHATKATADSNVSVWRVSEYNEGMVSDARSENDGPVVKAAANGDLAAFEVLIERYQRRANAVAYRLLSNVDDAMEVVQDSFLKAYENLQSLSQPERFGAWLMRIVANNALNRRRARAIRKTSPLEFQSDDSDRAAPIVADDGSVSPLEEVSAVELKEKIDEAIASLPEPQRQALVMFSIGKMPQKDVAKAMGCSVQIVKWNVFTARKKLKEILADYL